MARPQLAKPEIYLYSLTISHVAAVVLPVVLGLGWMISPADDFPFGAAIALLSLLLTQCLAGAPEWDYETVFAHARAARANTPAR